MPAKKGRAWRQERASVNRAGKRPRSNKYRPSADSGKKPSPGTRKRIWVGGHMRNGRPVRGHYRENPYYQGE